MYRKKTVLLSDLSLCTTRPIGVAGFVSDGRQTKARINVGGQRTGQKYHVYVECDGVFCVKPLDKLFNSEFVFEESQLENVDCLILSGESPLCFGSSHGNLLTRQFLSRAVDAVLTKKVNGNFNTEKSSDKALTSEMSDYQKTTATVTSGLKPQDSEPTQSKAEEVVTGLARDFYHNGDGIFFDKAAAVITESHKQASKEDQKQSENASTPFLNVETTEYENFVDKTSDYFGGINLNVADSKQLKSKAKVSLSEYSQALQRFYDKPNKETGYYDSVKDELQRVFDSYLPYLPLIRLYEESFFVKITDKKGRFFALGLLQRDGEPSYICYALPKTTPLPDPLYTHTATVEDGQTTINFCFIFQSATDGKVLPFAA